MSVVLHLGAHKTGTSLIQKYFRDRAGDFVGHRVTAVSRSDTNRLIGWGDMVRDKPMRLRHRLEAELRREPDVVLVSHENSLGRPFDPETPGVYPHAAELAEALASATDGLDVSVVFYFRPMADFVESYYLQTIHEGAWHGFDEWYATVDPESLSWRPVVAALDRAFGAERTILGDFSEISDGQNEFLTRFIQRADIPLPPAVRYQPRRNASISELGLDIARTVNPLLTSKAQRRATRQFLQENFSNVDGDRARPMSAADREHLTQMFASEAEDLTHRSRAGLVS